ncbi:MAG: hypothetical protein IJP11_09370 [Oscillospiraceae bacterium]|nr:hypothetical protein [Oscillospiraceae bacterium]
MRKPFLIIIVAILLSALLCGCRLAQPDAGNSEKDRMIGVLITTEPLDMMDSEYTEPITVELTNAEIRKLKQGDFAALDFPERQYDAKLITEEDGRQVWSFDHLGGWALMAPTMTDEHGEYIAAGSSDGLCDVKTHIKSADECEELLLSGTLYRVISEEDIIFEMNPIYQTADGRVYAVPGRGSSFQSDIASEGISFTQTLDEAVSRNGITERTEAAVSFGQMYRPDSVILLHMGQDGEILHREEYPAGQLPAELTPADGTVFLLVETVKRDLSGKELITAEVYDQTDGSFTTFFAEGNLCRTQTTSILWQ